MITDYRVDDKYIVSMTEHTEEYKPLRIILIGYMGAGKTTVGRALSKELNIPFYDLDWYIESRMRKTVKQIFDERGEEGFRMGGTPCFFDNMEYMNGQAETVYLKAETDVLYKHLLMGKSVRPLLLNKTADEVNLFIREQLKHREPFYTKAKHVLDVSLMDSYDKIQISVNQLCQLLKLNKANSLK